MYDETTGTDIKQLTWKDCKTFANTILDICEKEKDIELLESWLQGLLAEIKLRGIK